MFELICAEGHYIDDDAAYFIQPHDGEKTWLCRQHFEARGYREGPVFKEEDE